MNDSIVTRSLNPELSTLITKSTAADLRSEEQRFALLCSMKDAGFEFAVNVKAYDPETNPRGATKPEREFLRDAVIKGLAYRTRGEPGIATFRGQRRPVPRSHRSWGVY